jgi:hypothetical protein
MKNGAFGIWAGRKFCFHKYSAHFCNQFLNRFGQKKPWPKKRAEAKGTAECMGERGKGGSQFFG